MFQFNQLPQISGSSNWCRIVGQVDLEPYIAPYLLTGLCDENEVVGVAMADIILHLNLSTVRIEQLTPDYAIKRVNDSKCM